MAKRISLFLLALSIPALPSIVRADTVEEAAPVLGRIIEKNLVRDGIEVRSLQWARLEGRGLLYLAGLNVVSMEIAHEDGQPSPDDLVWENARREHLRRTARKPEDARQARRAIETVQEALDRFADRIPMPEAEEVRVTLYAYASPGNCASCHRGNVRLFRKGKDISAIDDFLANTPAHSMVPSPHDSRDFVVVTKAGVDDGRNETQEEDGAVLAKVLDKILAQSFPDEYWGVDMSGRAGALALGAGGWGPVIALNMTFPLRKTAPVTPREEHDLWVETLREIRGDRRVEPAGGQVDEGKGVLADRFLRTVKEVLADFAGRVRGLAPDQEVIVLVYGGGGQLDGSRSLYAISRQGSFQRQKLLDKYDVVIDENNLHSVPIESDERGFRVRTIARRGVAARPPDFVLRIAAKNLFRATGEAPERAALMSKIRVE